METIVKNGIAERYQVWRNCPVRCGTVSCVVEAFEAFQKLGGSVLRTMRFAEICHAWGYTWRTEMNTR